MASRAGVSLLSAAGGDLAAATAIAERTTARRSCRSRAKPAGARTWSHDSSQISGRLALSLVPSGRQKNRSAAAAARMVVHAAAAEADFGIFEDLEQFNTTSSGMMTEASSGERRLGREVLHLEKENWLLAGQERAAEKLEVAEDTEVYFEFLQRIALCAQEGDGQGAERAAMELEGKGLALGPRAYHGLVYAFIKMGDTPAALAAWREAFIKGIDPLVETYVILVRGIFQNDQPPAQAVTLVSFMKRWHGSKAEVAWQELVVGLFESGYGTDGEEEFQNGIRRSWKANHTMYTALIRSLCERDDDERNVDRAHHWLRHMNKSGLLALDDQVEPIIKGYIRFTRPETAIDLFRCMGKEGLGPPTTRISDEILLGAGDYLLENEALGVTFNMMKKFDALPSSEIYASMLFAVLASQKGINEYVKFLHEYPEILQPNGAVNDMMLAMLFEGLASAEDPMPMILLLEALDVLGRELPDAISKPDSAGLTFISRFISVNFMTIYETEAEKRVAQDTWEEPAIREVDGELIGVGNCIVDEEGNVIAPSKLTVGQLRAELNARGLSDEGLRKDLYKRVQAARKSAPEAMAELAKRRSDKKREEKRVELDAKRAKVATTYLDEKIKWAHFKFDKFGEPYCYHVELLSIRDLEKHYHLTAQTRTMWGIPRAFSGGSGDAGGDPWSEAPDPYIPEGMSVEEVSELMWKHAKRDGLTPAYYRSMLDEESDVPLPEEVERLTRMEVTEDGNIDYVDLEPEPEDGLTDEEGSQEGARMEALTEEIRACIQTAHRIAEIGELHGVLPSEADISLLVTVANHGSQTSDVPDLATMIELHSERLEAATMAKMFQTLVTTCLNGGEIRLAYETFSRMLNAGVPRDMSVDELELKIQHAEEVQDRAEIAA